MCTNFKSTWWDIRAEIEKRLQAFLKLLNYIKIMFISILKFIYQMFYFTRLPLAN